MFPLPYATQMGLHNNNYGPQLKQMQDTDFLRRSTERSPKSTGETKTLQEFEVSGTNIYRKY